MICFFFSIKKIFFFVNMSRHLLLIISSVRKLLILCIHDRVWPAFPPHLSSVFDFYQNAWNANISQRIFYCSMTSSYNWITFFVHLYRISTSIKKSRWIRINGILQKLKNGWLNKHAIITKYISLANLKFQRLSYGIIASVRKMLRSAIWKVHLMQINWNSLA